MDAERSRYGPLISALGAIALAVAVFLPWYGVSFTAVGISFVQQISHEVVGQFGNSALQGYLASAQAHLTGLAGHELGAVSAHQALKRLNVILLLVAGAGILLSLIPLARPGGSLLTGGDGQLIALLGILAGLCVAFRMVDRPSPAGELISLSLREGAWLALLGSLAMIVGGLWPRDLGVRTDQAAKVQAAWTELSGWSPEA